MKRCMVLAALTLLWMLTVTGCSGTGDSMWPAAGPGTTLGVSSRPGNSHTHLWGYYDVYVDIENQTATAVLNRQAMFSANVVQFVNKNPANLSFQINGTPIGLDYVDVDIDVGITHPFPGLTEYNGYDVRGVFIGDGSQSLAYNADLDYAVLGKDQFMKDFNETNDEAVYGDPDGYTRWFNPTEFKTPGLFGYTPGKVATPGYFGSATLNPYKYYADGLKVSDDLWTWLNNHPGSHGVFSAGATNTRNYYLRFPNAKGVQFNYAIVANWEDVDVHPANTVEAPDCEVNVTPDIWYADELDKGGDLILDISLWGWEHQPSTIFVESTVLSAPHQFTVDEMIPVGGDENYSTYHVEIPADNIHGSGWFEFWVIAQYDEFDYTNEFGVSNLAGTDPLAAFFRCDFYISPISYNTPPVVDSGVEGNDEPHVLLTYTYTVTAHDDDGDPLDYLWTVTEASSGNPLIEDDPGNGDGTIDIDWDALNAALGEEYDIDCEVSDGTDSVWAETLTVTGSNIVFQDDMESGEGEWLTSHAGNTANNGWEIVSGGNDGHWWHSNAGTTYLYQPDCSKLWTPEITIPAAASNCHVEIFHTVRGYFWSNTISQGGMATASYDDGASFETTYKPPVIAGEQYTNEGYPYTATYFWALCNAGCGYGAPGSGLCWGWRVWANSNVTNTTSTLDYGYFIGDTIRIGFLYASYYYNGTYYWGLDDIMVTADP